VLKKWLGKPKQVLPRLILPDECVEIIYYDAKLFSGRRATRSLYLLSKRAKGSRLASAKNDTP